MNIVTLNLMGWYSLHQILCPSGSDLVLNLVFDSRFGVPFGDGLNLKAMM